MLLILVLAGCSDAQQKNNASADSSSDAATADTDSGNNSPGDGAISWGFVNSTAQLVSQSVDPRFCENGWTNLVDRLMSEGRQNEPPLQPDYVTTFGSIEEMASASERVYPLVGEPFKTIRISLSWPCWMSSDAWKDSFVDAIETIRHAGFVVEITLSHHDSYPMSLADQTPGTGVAHSGWAHDTAVAAFREFVESAMYRLRDVLPSGARVYIINEPVGMAMNSFTGEGKWPPGGKRAGAGLARALQHLRDAHYEAIPLIRNAGYQPVVIKNIRPAKGDKTKIFGLDWVFNWWLLDALLHGCIDNDFDGFCEDEQPPSDIDLIGVTFYGVMYPSEATVNLGADTGNVTLPLPRMDFTPDSSAFKESLRSVVLRYEGVRVFTAEIGFSSGSVDTMTGWLNSYIFALRTLVDQKPAVLPELHFHSLYESAEFAAGEWFFHAVRGGCQPGQTCGLTAWGERLLEIARAQ